jgi:PLD-like domain
MKVTARAYLSPTLVLLAFDWDEGATRQDFLGFAIERRPGFWGQFEKSWLPNRLTFSGPAAEGHDVPSLFAPIQKFMWWDARIDDTDRGKSFNYRIVPVVGTPGHLNWLDGEAGTLQITIPHIETGGVGSYFNRAVMSSQAFARHFPNVETKQQIEAAFRWLANGIERAIPNFLGNPQSDSVEGAIYHFNDDFWTLPALEVFPTGKLKLAYNHTTDDHESDGAIASLVAKGHPQENFQHRTKANISHNKFLVRSKGNAAVSVLTGSANFTTAGLTRQANVLHTFKSPKLAGLYRDRARLLMTDPKMADVRTLGHWSDPVDDVPHADIRVFFPPEKKPSRASLDAIVQAVHAAESSVIFCCFMPTDMQIINACLDAADAGRMMFGLVDNAKEPGENASAYEPKLAIYHRSRDHRDVAGKEAFNGDAVPLGFTAEREFFTGEDPIRAVRIHHKFVIIDAETDQPIIYTGSANLSANALYNNDENLIEIVGHVDLARAYLAEFMRLYEHYRARLFYVQWLHQTLDTFKLMSDAKWAAKYYRPTAPEFKARLAMVGKL